MACLTRDWASFGGSFLVTKWIAGGENLHLFGWRLAKRAPDERLRIATECADSLGRLIGRMHAAGAAHRDLKAANLVVVENETGLKTWLVDLDGLQIGRSVSLGGAATSPDWRPALTHILGSRCSILAPLPASVCGGAYPAIAIEWKPLWRAIAARAAKIVRRKQNRGQDVL